MAEINITNIEYSSKFNVATYTSIMLKLTLANENVLLST